MLKAMLTAGALALGLTAAAGAAEIRSSVDAATLDKEKATPLGLYLTPRDAHEALTADPAIVFVDVRDPIEVAFVGHPQGMDANIPVKIATHDFDAKKGSYAMKANASFVAEVERLMVREGRGKADPVFVMCRSGGRAADAAKLLAAEGFTNVWNLVEGFEGDMDKPTGQRSVNGWRNAGLPWSYKLDASAAWQPPAAN